MILLGLEACKLRCPNEKKTSHVEQVYLSERLADAVYNEARRREVSRAQVLREAIENHLGFRDEGRSEPCRREMPDRNYGRK